MDEIKKMLTAMMNGQSAMRQELKGDIGKVRGDIQKLDEKIDNVDAKLTKRLDNLGLQLAELEEDSPTREEFEGMEKRVGELEIQQKPI